MTALDTTTTGPATASVPIIPPRQQREKVLIVCHADGWIEFLDQQPQETASGPTLPRATRCQKSNARPEE
ncbi:MAG TPA: hypothetical protein QF564_29930 [Pirellulaceae bacterium]|nr:hypothetical protein [Pirellulaceae bacterium]